MSQALGRFFLFIQLGTGLDRSVEDTRRYSSRSPYSARSLDNTARHHEGPGSWSATRSVVPHSTPAGPPLAVHPSTIASPFIPSKCSISWSLRTVCYVDTNMFILVQCVELIHLIFGKLEIVDVGVCFYPLRCIRFRKWNEPDHQLRPQR